MRVIYPQNKPAQSTNRDKRRWPYMMLLLVLVAGCINYARPLPQTAPQILSPQLPQPKDPTLPWPVTGQTAVAAENYGVLTTHGAQTPIATASVAKVITALCVLQKSPISSNEPGPIYTVSQTDINIYNSYQNKDASLVPVVLGETLTERQMLEALMIPSANNIADSMASWVFGGQQQYATFAAHYLLQHGITHTAIGSDASGFDPSTTSTAKDLAQIGLLALQNSTLMSVAGEQSVSLPVVGTLYNYNSVLGQNGITGLKTGNSDQDTGAFLFTANITVNGKPLRIAGAVMGQPSLNEALRSAVDLASASGSGFTKNTVITKGQQVGTLRTAWGSLAAVRAARSVSLDYWQGTPLRERNTIGTSVGHAGTVGTLEILAGSNGSSTPLVIPQSAPGPPFWWRILRH